MVGKSIHVKSRQCANPVDQATLTVNEKILRECHTVYTDADRGKCLMPKRMGSCGSSHHILSCILHSTHPVVGSILYLDVLRIT